MVSMKLVSSEQHFLADDVWSASDARLIEVTSVRRDTTNVAGVNHDVAP